MEKKTNKQPNNKIKCSNALVKAEMRNKCPLKDEFIYFFFKMFLISNKKDCDEWFLVKFSRWCLKNKTLSPQYTSILAGLFVNLSMLICN